MAPMSPYPKPLIKPFFSLLVIICCATNLSLTTAVAAARREAPAGGGSDDTAMRERYERWAAKHGRNHKDPAEKARRYEVFKSNAEFVDSYNAAAEGKSKSSPRLSTNKFSDLTDKEFQAMYVGGLKKRFKGSIPGFLYGNLSESDVTPSRDWRAMGAVTGVKDQSVHCASCWAFSAAAAVEGIHAIKTGKLVSLSEQQLLDCSTGRKNRGCNKGDMEEAFLYIAGHGSTDRKSGGVVVPAAGSISWGGGISEESVYPYQALQSNCSASGKQVAAKITGFQYVPANNETALLLAVSQQPVSVALDVRNKAFQHYSSGIYGAERVKCNVNNLNHALTVVGYGTDEHGTKYWVMKNSWGTGWGEGGYVRIARDVASDTGLCGLAVQASYPVA